MIVVNTVPVGILVDRDPILAWKMMGGRTGDLVVDRPQVFVATDHREACRIRILQVLDNPEPAPRVELERERLADIGVGEYQLDIQAFHRCQRRDRLGRWTGATVVFQLAELGDCCFPVGQGGKTIGCRISFFPETPLVTVAGTVLPLSPGPDGLLFRRQDRGRDIEISAAEVTVGTNCKDIGLAKEQVLRLNAKGHLASQATTELGRHAAKGDDFHAVEIDLASVVDRLGKKVDLLALPALGDHQLASVPGVSQVIPLVGRGGPSPDSRDIDRLPRIVVVLGRETRDQGGPGDKQRQQQPAEEASGSPSGGRGVVHGSGWGKNDHRYR